MRIDSIEFDDGNIEHATRHGITVAEIVGVFASAPIIRRNRGGRAADYHAVARGIRVNVLYRPGVARPISAWRVNT